MLSQRSWLGAIQVLWLSTLIVTTEKGLHGLRSILLRCSPPKVISHSNFWTAIRSEVLLFYQHPVYLDERFWDVDTERYRFWHRKSQRKILIRQIRQKREMPYHSMSQHGHVGFRSPPWGWKLTCNDGNGQYLVVRLTPTSTLCPLWWRACQEALMAFVWDLHTFRGNWPWNFHSCCVLRYQMRMRRILFVLFLWFSGLHNDLKWISTAGWVRLLSFEIFAGCGAV